MPNIRSCKKGALLVSLACSTLAGAGQAHAPRAPDIDVDFGAALRTTLAAQVIEPAPQYPNGVAPTAADHAAQAAERYRTDKVKLPDRPKTSKLEADKGSAGS